MRVAELSGPLLDMWVANALKIKAKMVMPGDPINGVIAREMFCATLTAGHTDWYQPFHPSTSWFEGGPIMEDAPINFTRKSERRGGGVFASYAATDGFYGETMLIAAMRAVVAATFGAEV
jgi:hypothetical protein